MTILNSRFGFYEVGDKVFTNKILALEHASKTNLVWPKFNFNDSVFSKFNWLVEPPFSLSEAYRLRAQQLREKYDYLILYYSGGVDSHNILKTFIQNNIKIDSVVIYGTFEFDKDKNSKFNLELYNAAIPFALKHQHLYDLKILDISNLFDKHYSDDWIFQSGVQLAPYEYIMSYTTTDAYFQQLFDKGSVGIIRGNDKPRVIYYNSEYYLAFLDHGVMQTPTALIDDKHNGSQEYFYWSPDSPWLISKQAHVIKNYFENINPKNRHLLTHTHEFRYSTIEQYIVPLIYEVGVAPGNKATYYNLGKSPTGPVFHHKDEWFHSGNLELKSQKMWYNGIHKIDNILDPQYKNNGKIRDGLVGIWSKWYKL